MTLLLCGDVMTGRGVDQILPHPGDPRLAEPRVLDARTYVELAEKANGPIARPVAFSYVWGDALAEPGWSGADVRIVNLETSVSRSDQRWPGKGIHYRMSPENLPCLTAARIDVCALANNHVLDHGYGGLVETLEVLRRAGVKTAGAGRDLEEARRPAIVELSAGGRVIVMSFGTEASGIPSSWAAARGRPGVDLVRRLDDETAAEIGERARRMRRPGDIVVASVHWGTNWGFEVPAEHVRFAHRLIDTGVDVLHGHSSHHVRPIEAYRGRLILYGCGDFIDDYEGIEGYEDYRNDLVLAYVAALDPARGELEALRMRPLQVRRMRLARAEQRDAEWLADTLNEIGEGNGPRFDLAGDGTLTLRPAVRQRA
ncbi:MAG TPA: CapA family protein [Anaeromyxobacter sp.]|nr:CapA family protein [Anaeromyxobacter sp.]